MVKRSQGWNGLCKTCKRACLTLLETCRKSISVFYWQKVVVFEKNISIELWEVFVLEIQRRDLVDLSSFVVMGNHYSLQTH